MTATKRISAKKLWAGVAMPDCPVLIDARTDEDFAADPRLLPAARRRSGFAAADWGGAFAGRSVVIYCERGLKISQGAAALLRHAGIDAGVLEGGFQGWRESGLPLVPERNIPPRDAEGRTVWVTRARPKVDRIACPWLIRRFVDPTAVFLFVEASQVTAVAERFGVTPFDVENVFWSHREERCTFDAMIEEFGLGTEPMLRLAAIVRGADTSRLDLAPEAAGLLAACLGLSRMYDEDLAQLEAGMALYDGFYHWARAAAERET